MKRVSLTTRFGESHSNVERLMLMYCLIKDVHQHPLHQQGLMNLELNRISIDDQQFHFESLAPMQQDKNLSQKQQSNLYTLGQTLYSLLMQWQTDSNNPPFEDTAIHIETLAKNLLCPLWQQRWSLKEALDYFQAIPIREAGGFGLRVEEYLHQVNEYIKQQKAQTVVSKKQTHKESNASSSRGTSLFKSRHATALHQEPTIHADIDGESNSLKPTATSREISLSP